MLNGLGFFIWRLKNLGNIDATISKLTSIGVSWVSIKVRDGIYTYNYVNSNGVYTGEPSYLHYVINKFRSAGISVGTWHFVDTDWLTEQGRLISEDIRTFGFSHLLIDAEHIPTVGANWKQEGASKLATQYMNAINVPSGFPVGLCSYRFPNLHRPFPFEAFLFHRTNVLNAPQMYWIGSQNSAEQLERSYKENKAIRDLPFYPMGATFPEHGWEPTVQSIKDFITKAKQMGFKGWGFWSLDAILSRPDWLEAVAESKPNPEPEPEPEKFPIMKVQTGYLRIRSAIIPSVKYGPTPGRVYTSSSVWFVLPSGSPVEVIETIVDGRNIWARVGQRQYAAIKYDDVIYLA